MSYPNPTPIYRIVHVDSLTTILVRGALHAPNHTPVDGLPYRTIHDVNVQANRRVARVPCGPRGNIHDYVPFYFGVLSVMLLKLTTGQVAGYAEGQEPLVYLVTTAQRVVASGARIVFTNGHGLATFTNWFDDLGQLGSVDWMMVEQRYWSDRPEDNDRQRRKQAECLVWQTLDWALIQEIAVLNAAAKFRVDSALAAHPHRAQPPVNVRSGWYY